MRMVLLVCTALVLSSAPLLQAGESYGPHITAYPQEPFRSVAAGDFTVFTVDVYSTATAIEQASVTVQPSAGLKVVGVFWAHDGAPDCNFTAGNGLHCTYSTMLGRPLQLDVFVTVTAPKHCLNYAGLTVVATTGDRTARHDRAKLERADRACLYLPDVRS
jgi:hypothetical protein